MDISFVLVVVIQTQFEVTSKQQIINFQIQKIQLPKSRSSINIIEI